MTNIQLASSANHMKCNYIRLHQHDLRPIHTERVYVCLCPSRDYVRRPT